MIERRAFSVPLPHAESLSASHWYPESLSASHWHPGSPPGLHGELALTDEAKGIVVFVAAQHCANAAGKGDIAERMQQSGISTLVIDLLLDSEAHYADAESHLPLLTERLLAVLTRLHREMGTQAIAAQGLGLIAAGPTTPVAVRAAALRDNEVRAVVCRGGLVDLAGLQYLKVLQAPLLMIAGSADVIPIDNLRRAMPHIPAPVAREILADSAENADAREAALALAWFQRHLSR